MNFHAVWLLLVLTYGACEPAVNSTEGDCEVRESTAFCDGKLTEDTRIKQLVVKGMKKIEKNDLTKYENLESLDLSHSAVHHIDNDALTSNEKLVKLNLSGAKDLHIPKEGSFISSKSLTHLNLSQIALEVLPKTFFQDLPNLKVIDLSSTAIKTFSSLSKLQHLTTLIISEDTTLNKLSICNETHLHQIIVIENDKQTTFNCSKATNKNKKTKESEIVITTPTSVAEDSDKKDDETITVKSETTAPETEISETNDTVVEKEEPKSGPENLEAIVTTQASKESEIESHPEEADTSKVERKDVVPDNSELVKNEETNSTETENTTNLEIPEATPEVNASSSSETTTEIENPPEFVEKKNDTVISAPGQTQISDVESKKDSIRTHEDIKRTDGVAEVEAVKPNPSQSNGTNIVLGIILCVMIVGAIGFGYKYLKKRRSGYRNANTEDVEEGKELQNMVAHHTTNETEQR